MAPLSLRLESHKVEVKVSAGLCPGVHSLLSVHLSFQRPCSLHGSWPPSVIFIVSINGSVLSHALNHSASFIFTSLCLSACLFHIFKGPRGYTGHAQIIQGILAKVRDLHSIFRVPLPRNVTYFQVAGNQPWASLVWERELFFLPHTV